MQGVGSRSTWIKPRNLKQISYIAQKKRKEIDADLKDSKTKKQKLEVLVKQLCDEADTLSSDAEKNNKM